MCSALTQPKAYNCIYMLVDLIVQIRDPHTNNEGLFLCIGGVILRISIAEPF